MLYLAYALSYVSVELGKEWTNGLQFLFQAKSWLTSRSILYYALMCYYYLQLLCTYCIYHDIKHMYFLLIAAVYAGWEIELWYFLLYLAFILGNFMQIQDYG